MVQAVSQAQFLFSWVAVGSHTFAETSHIPAGGRAASLRAARWLWPVADGRKGKAPPAERVGQIQTLELVTWNLCSLKHFEDIFATRCT